MNMTDISRLETELNARITDCAGYYEVLANADLLTYTFAKKVSEAFGTDKIDFSPGERIHEPGYSSWTPSYSFTEPACLKVYK